MYREYIEQRNVSILYTDLLVIATNLLDLACERLYSTLGDAVLVKSHLELPLDLVIVGLNLSELTTLKRVFF